MPTDLIHDFYERWLRLWNGEPALAEDLVAPDCASHQAPFEPREPESFRGPDGIRRMVEQGRAPFADITFSVEIGPIAEGDLLAARWVSHGSFRGDLPGASAPAGTPVTCHGIDMMRIENGKIAEYWVSSDGVDLMAQLGMR